MDLANLIMKTVKHCLLIVFNSLMALAQAQPAIIVKSYMTFKRNMRCLNKWLTGWRFNTQASDGIPAADCKNIEGNVQGK